MLKSFPYPPKPFSNPIATFVRYATKASKGIRISKCTAAATKYLGSYSRSHTRWMPSKKRSLFAPSRHVSTTTLAMPLVTSLASKNTSAENTATKSTGFVTNALKLMLFIPISKLTSKPAVPVAIPVIVAVSFPGPL